MSKTQIAKREPLKRYREILYLRIFEHYFETCASVLLCALCCVQVMGKSQLHTKSDTKTYLEQ